MPSHSRTPEQRPLDVAQTVVCDALRMAGLGTAAGVAIALAIAPLVQSLLFQTSAREPTSVILAAAILLGVTLGAAAWPAWRASRVSPMTALRSDT
jgi:putative ABC transport system permease protein